MQQDTLIASVGTLDEARPLLERAEQHDGASPVSDQALLAVSQGQRDLTLFAPAAVGAAPVAVGVLGQGELDLVVDPAARGVGVGSQALAALLAPDGADRVPAASLLAWAHGENPAASALLSRFGFRPVRSLYRMALEPALLPKGAMDPLAVALPDGFELRTFSDGDAPAWVAANAQAFADHPEQGKLSVADFTLLSAEPWFDAADLFLLSAPNSDDLAGFTWVKTVRDAGAVETELYAIGIVPGFAGSGLGRALLRVTLARMAEHRPDRVTLYVDGENSRAVGMYEAAGFTIDSRSTQWRGPQVSE